MALIRRRPNRTAVSARKARLDRGPSYWPLYPDPRNLLMFWDRLLMLDHSEDVRDRATATLETDWPVPPLFARDDEEELEEDEEFDDELDDDDEEDDLDDDLDDDEEEEEFDDLDDDDLDDIDDLDIDEEDDDLDDDDDEFEDLDEEEEEEVEEP